MELPKINDILKQLENDKTNGRNHILNFAAALIEWMGFPFAENDKPRLLDFQTLKLKEALAPAPITGQEQLYRLTADGQPIRIRFAVLKKFDKKIVQYLVDNNVGLTSYQASMRGIKQIEGREPFIAQQPYFVHFITTAKYDRLWIVFNEGEQKRVLVFRNRLSQTQFNKILPAWRNISAKSKPEMAKLFWKSLDVKEVNKDFYKLIKEQFDTLVGIAKSQNKDFDESMTKQFAVRLIGRYIFCWFLKEKEIIPEALISSKTIKKFKDSYFQTLLSKLFFKTLNAEVTDPARTETITGLDELYKNIPYLNGGLFDWHPEDVLFELIDLNGWLIAFVKVLESFDFTVDESSSQYQQVAIDPEMLGRIFENLLASQNPDTEKMANQRKAFGAFYTPREIVDYMVNESLKAFVETQLFSQLPEQANRVSEPAVEIKGTLFQDIVAEPQNALYSKAEIAEIERKRERLKIKIDKLFAPDCVENPFDKDETIQLRKALSEIKVLDPACGSGAFPMGVLLRLMELRQITGHGHRNNYDLKEEILSKNIFGVDIMPMAIEIARLRAWLSLVLESDYKPADRKNNFGIAALPNLDFKFVCANSLIDSGYDVFLENVHRNATLYRLDGEIQKLEQLRNAYFDPQGDKNKKTELQNEFLKTKDYIKTGFESLKKSWNLEDFLSKVDDWNPFDDNHPSSFFSPAWMFGIREGFDVVIGNPPYVQLSKAENVSNDYKQYLKTRFKTSAGRLNTFIFFIHQSLENLSSSGQLALIIPNTILTQEYYSYTRELILKDYQLKEIVNYENMPFENAVVENVTLFVQTKKTNSIYKVKITSDDLSSVKLIAEKDLSDFLYQDNFSFGFKSNSIIENAFCLKDIVKVGEICEVNQAIALKGDKNLSLRNQNSDYKYFKLLDGRNIEKFEIKWRGVYLDYSKDRIHSCKRKDIFESKEKLLFRRVSENLVFAYDDQQYFALNTLVAVNLKIQEEFSLKYIIAILNSSLINYIYKNKFKSTKKIFSEIQANSIEKLPIKKIRKEEQKPFIERVEKILSAKAQNLDTSALEKEIDVLVYKLYELTYDEVKVIDKDFWMSEEDYIAIKI